MSGWLGGLLGTNARETLMRGVGAVTSTDRNLSNLNVDSLLDKVALETLPLEDRKEALNQLTSVGKNGFQAIGSKMNILTKFLESNKSDVEVIRDVVETLTSIMTCHPKDDNIIQIHNTELFINDKNSFIILCDLLVLPDYYVRYYIARLLKVILDNRFESVQELILSCPMSVPNIMGLLSDNREMIRNEIILVLLELTKSNQEIQKIVAFEGAFDILLDIIKKEGQSEGGVIVNDCIQTLINLLKLNVSNQNYFRETGCIPRISPLLQVQNTDMWILSDNKFTIIMSTLDVILTLVERNNLSTPLNQSQICTSGMMNLIIRLGLGKMSSQIIRSKSLYTLGEIIHMHTENIGEFSSVSIKSELSGQSQSALLRMTQVILYSKDLIEKISASHVFKCYLSGNEEAQMGLASTITPISPPTAGVDAEEELSIGQHLVRSLFAWEQPIPNIVKIDSSSFWFSSIVLCHTLRDSAHTKEKMLGCFVDTTPTLLFNKLLQSLLATKKLESNDSTMMIKVGLLKMLAVWLDSCPRVAKELLSNNQLLTFIVESIQQPPNPSTVHVQGLFALVLGLYVYNLGEEYQADKVNLSQIIHQRIGLSSFKDRLDQLRKTDAFTHAEQGEQEEFTTSSERLNISLYDFDFTLFFKDTQDKIRNIGSTTNQIQKKPGTRQIKDKEKENSKEKEKENNTPSISPPINQQSPLVGSPQVPHLDKNHLLPNPQDLLKIQQLEFENNELKNQLNLHLQQLKQLQQQQQPNIDLKDELLLEKDREIGILSAANSKLEDLVIEKDDQIEDLLSKLQQQQQQQLNLDQGSPSTDIFELMRLRSENQDYITKTEMLTSKLDQHQHAIQSLRLENQTILQQRDEAIKKITSFANQQSKTLEQLSPPGGLIIAKLEGELNDLKAKYASIEKDQDELMENMATMELENGSLRAQLSSLNK